MNDEQYLHRPLLLLLLLVLAPLPSQPRVVGALDPRPGVLEVLEVVLGHELVALELGLCVCAGHRAPVGVRVVDEERGEAVPGPLAEKSI